MMKAKVRFLCHFCQIIIISERDTVEDAFLSHIQSCMAVPNVRERLGK